MENAAGIKSTIVKACRFASQTI